MTLAVRVELNELEGSRWPTLDAPSPAADFSAELDRLSCTGRLTPSRMLRATPIC